MSKKVTASDHDGVRVVTIDDGKANALDAEILSALTDEFERASREDRALVLLGRAGFLSAGLDNHTLARGGEEAERLLSSMGHLLVGLAKSQIPFVVGCSGHATAAGAMLLLVGQRRVAADGAFRIGFSEVGLGLALPELPIELARARLLPSAFEAATAQAKLFAPGEAARVGFADRVVPAPGLAAAALEEAKTLAALDRTAYRETLERVRAPWISKIESQLPPR